MQVLIANLCSSHYHLYVCNYHSTGSGYDNFNIRFHIYVLTSEKDLSRDKNGNILTHLFPKESYMKDILNK